MEDDEDEDRFTRAINDTLQAQAGADEYKPVTVDAETLRSLYRAEVFCCAPRQPGLRATYYKSAIPDVHIGVEIKILRRVRAESTRRLLDGVAMPVLYSSTEPEMTS